MKVAITFDEWGHLLLKRYERLEASSKILKPISVGMAVIIILETLWILLLK